MLRELYATRAMFSPLRHFITMAFSLFRYDFLLLTPDLPREGGTPLESYELPLIYAMPPPCYAAPSDIDAAYDAIFAALLPCCIF